MIIKGVSAKTILDSRKEKTVLVSVKTNAGEFSASAPNGKSTGSYEKKPYKKSLEEDIKAIKQFGDYFSEDILDKFDDLRRVEDVMDRQIGANTLFAFESAILKAIAKEQKKQVWELIDNNAKRFPRLVGNCIGGGKHSSLERKPDFQEFLLIPDLKSVKEAFETNKKAKKEAEWLLKKEDEKFEGNKNDEDAWAISLNDKIVLEILKNLKLPLGIDVAATGFYKRKKYHYHNPPLDRENEEHFEYLCNLIRNFNLFYIEDPFEEGSFEDFAKLLKKFPERLKMKSINAIIVKPNQIGSLIEVKEVVELAKKNNIKIVFSHRSGETEETILADLAFGFQADFFKCGITGKERETKIKRLIEIEKSLK